jgi:hypothetical protein
MILAAMPRCCDGQQRLHGGAGRLHLTGGRAGDAMHMAAMLVVTAMIAVVVYH